MPGLGLAAVGVRFPSPVPWPTGSSRSLSSGPIRPPKSFIATSSNGIGDQAANAASAATAKGTDAADGEMAGPRPSDADRAEATPAGQSTPGQAGDGKSVLGNMVDGLLAMIAQAGQTFVVLKDKAQWEWVDHSHLLRKLVHEFRDGDPAKALRRAISITPPDGPVRSHESGPSAVDASDL